VRLEAWIDWNNDKDFSDSGEHVFSSAFAGDVLQTATIAVPTNAVPGTTRMRIALSWSVVGPVVDGGAFNPTYPYGEAEDYSVFVPWIYNTGATNILDTSATLQGYLVLTNELPTDVYVYWGSSDQTTNAASWDHVITIANCTPGAFATNVTGLIVNTTYFYRCYASNSVEQEWAPTSSVFTTRVSAPIIANLAPTNLGYTTARLEGELLNPGWAPSAVYVYWGTTDVGQTTIGWDHSAYVGTYADFTNVSLLAADLVRRSTSYYRFYATNLYGQSWCTNATSFVAFPDRASYPPLSQDGWFFDILRVRFANLDNVTGDGPGSYNDYSALPAAQVIPGDSVPLTIDTSTWGENPRWISAWIDWNQDCDFNDTNELVLNVHVNPTDSPNSAIVAIPTNAVVDMTRMRVIVSYFDPVNGSITGNGEAEDYSVYVLPGLRVFNTMGATNFTTSSADLQGYLVLTNGLPTDVCVYWGQSDRATNATAWDHAIMISNCAPGLFATNVTGLMPLINYYYQCYASNSMEQAWAPTSAVFMADWPAPAITNQTPIVGYTNALLKGRLWWPGWATDDVYVYWGTTDAGATSNGWDHGAFVGTFDTATNISLSVIGLERLGTYYYRFYATNMYGDGWAPEAKSFTVFPDTTSYPPLNQNGYHFWITQVTLSTLSSASWQTGYSDYTGLPAPELIPEHQYLLTVWNFTTAPNPRWVSAWADWNQDCDFSETNEEMLVNVLVAPNDTNPSTAMVTVPRNARIGPTRMRIIVSWNHLVDGSDYGPVPDLGEAEDYLVRIIVHPGGVIYIR
jgi:hypothetical protein